PRAGLGRRVLEFLHLVVLIVHQPLDAALHYAGDEGGVVGLGGLQAVDDDGGRVRPGLFAPAAEPAPAAVVELHGGQLGDAVLDHRRDLGLVEDRVAVVPLPAGRAAGVVADLLRVKVGAPGADVGEVHLHVEQDLL